MHRYKELPKRKYKSHVAPHPIKKIKQLAFLATEDEINLLNEIGIKLNMNRSAMIRASLFDYFIPLRLIDLEATNIPISRYETFDEK